jgi:hypothetical protein
MHHSTEKGTQVKPTEQISKAGPELRSDRSAKRFYGRKEVRILRRSRAIQGISALIAVLGSLVFAGAPAQAAIAHKYISQFSGAPSGSFKDGACGVTVDPATQDVYVVDPGNNAIDIFEPSGVGAYTYKSQISGLSVPSGSFDSSYICYLAVSDVTGDVYLASEDPELPDNARDIVYVFNASGTWIETLSPHDLERDSENEMTVDQSTGDLYIFVGNEELDLYNSKNEYQSALSFGPGYGPAALTTNSSGDVYGFGRQGNYVNGLYEFNSSGSQIALIAEIPILQAGRSHSLAFDSAGDFYLSNGDEFSPSGELEGQTRGDIAAVDSSNDLVVVEEGSPSVVDIYGPGVVVPGTTVQAPSSSGSTTAVASGVVNPAGVQVTSCEFEYGTSTSYGQSAECEAPDAAEIGKGIVPVAVHATLTGLQPNTTYYYRLNAANANGSANEAGGSGAETFTTPGIPQIVSESAEVKSTEKVGQMHATLQAQVNPDGRETTYDFEYGETASYGSSTTPGVLGSGEAPVPATTELSGLKLDTTYHYRVVASNECEVGKTCPAYGPDQTFTTVAALLVEGSSVSHVAATSATLAAQVDPLGSETSAYFQYGTVSCAASPASCTDVPLPPGIDIGSTEGYQAASEHLQDLAPSTTYYYRVIATNELGTIEGEHNVEGEEVVHTFTTQAPGSTLVLPDDRQWELVSPPDKHGALVVPINQFFGLIEAAADGDAMTYETNEPPELEPRGSTYKVQQMLSTRTSSGWGSQDIEPPNNYETGIRLNVGYTYRFFSPDLSLALLEPQGAFTPLEHDGVSEEVSPRASERTVYLRSDFTCQATPATCYTPLVTEANTPEGTKIGEDEEHVVQKSAAQFVGATPDLSHVVLTSNVPLTTPPVIGSSGLYEWSGGQLQLVSVLPASEGGAGVADAEFGGVTSETEEARNAISTDGSRVVWSNQSTHDLYMSDTAGGKTESVRIGGAGAEFTDASGDDSKVFFTEGAYKVNGNPHTGDLYVFEVTSGASEPLAGRVTRLTEGAEVQGAVLGASEDGSYVYFVANGALAPGAAPQLCREESYSESSGKEPKRPNLDCNLYVAHYNGEAKQWEAPSFIATLSSADHPDWFAGELKEHTSRVSPDGRFLAFMSQRSLTGYDNIDVNEHPTQEEERGNDSKAPVPAGTKVEHVDEEVYLYDAVEHKLVCASCNPTGARPVGVQAPEGGGMIDDESWRSGRIFLAANVPGFTPYKNYGALYQSRYLSDSGRLFFNSHEALAPQDVNGTWDVYEYEPPGIGSCTASNATFSSRSEGCVNLISSGESAEESAFLDASENGDDVFFMTTSELVPADSEASYSVYDAHVCGAEGVACVPSVVAPPQCTTEASCKPAPTPQPTLYAPPASATFNGPGNLAPPPPAVVKKVTTKTVKCKKGDVKNKKDKCVPKKKKSKKKAKKSSANRRAKS